MSVSVIQRTEGHGGAVHAVSETSRLGSVVEHVPEMASTPAAQHFGTCLYQAAVLAFEHRVVHGPPEARPPGATVELGIRGVEAQRAARTVEFAVPVFVVERASVRSFGAGV